MSIGTTARTAKKKETNLDSKPVELADENLVRKRKLKPHAVHYLQPKMAKESEECSESKINEDSVDAKAKKPKNAVEKLIEKNLEKSNLLNNKEIDLIQSKTSDKDKDKDYVREDEFEDDEEDDDDDDYDQEFKLKCEKNLKLSKKMKKITDKKQKKQSSKDLVNEAAGLDEEDENKSDLKTTGITPAAIGASSSKSRQQQQQQHHQANSKKIKKGYATTKQRLSKLLKLNRIVNI